VAPKEIIKSLMHFITEGKIVFSAGRYLLLQAKLTQMASGERKFHTKVLRNFLKLQWYRVILNFYNGTLIKSSLMIA